MRSVLLVVGDVSRNQLEPLRVAMLRDEKKSPLVVRVPSCHRRSELVQRLVVPPLQLTAREQLVIPSDHGENDDERVADLERETLVSHLADKGASLHDVKAVLVEYRPETDEVWEDREAGPWGWVSDHLQPDVVIFQLELAETGNYLWIPAAADVYERLAQVEIPLGS